MNFDALTTAIDAFSKNDNATARQYLNAYVVAHPGDEKGWFWMSRVAEHQGEKRECLKRMHDLRESGA